jgi:ethanolaminephosphotransferase
MANQAILLTIANLLIPVAIIVFATGFFPYKPFMPGLAQYEELGWEDAMGWKEGSVSEPPFDKLVFMVVDALRSDFVYGEESGMNFVQRYDLSSTFKSEQSSKLSKVDRYPV